MSAKWAAAFLLLVVNLWSAGSAQGAPFLVQQPTLSRTHIVFVFADDLWIVGRDGGRAQRLTTGEGLESNPYFSPDGSLVAFTGNYDGNTDVFVMPAAGGVPQRLTYHPVNDQVRGWTPDGTSVLFVSAREGYIRWLPCLYTISTEGGMPEQVPLPVAVFGAFSPDGKQIAYDPRAGAYQTWKRYRGGLASTIWLANLDDSSVTEIPRETWNNCHPMWAGDKVYFLSDREGKMTLYSYDPQSKQVEQEIAPQGFDLKWASAGPDAIVYEQFGSIHLFDLASRDTREVEIEIAADLPQVRSRFVDVSSAIQNVDVSPTGKRAVFEARGDILTVPAEKGDIRNLTRTPEACERDPAWSPDGKWIAYFSDQSGEYELHLMEQSGLEEPRRIKLSEDPSFYYSPLWSPDGKYLAYTDKTLRLWVLNVDEGTPAEVDRTSYREPFPTMNPAWSPDSKWLVYAKQLKSHVHAIFIYGVENGKARQITDGPSDARFPVFDRGGKYVYFTASTDIGPRLGWGEMSSLSRPTTRSFYVVTLNKELPSPLAPESDEEAVSEKKEEKEGKDKADGKKEEKKEVEVKIDFEGIDQRILALPIPAKNVLALEAGAEGTLFLAAGPQVERNPFGGQSSTIHQFDLKKKKTEKFLEGVSQFVVSNDGKKMLVQQEDSWSIVSAESPPKPGDGALSLDGLEVWVEPRAEWRQIYHEVWRIERDFLYDPNAHGLDLASAEKTYEPFLENLGSRDDLNYLISEMLGNLVLGHTRNRGGDIPEPEEVPVGLLGADLAVENGRHRIVHIYQGENWNPELRAPLTEPGVNVEEGDYLLAVNGRQVSAGDNLYSFFGKTAGKSVVLTVGSDPGGADSRQVKVVPVPDESTLRHRAWIEENRRKVDEMTNGRVGYVYVPDTALEGFANFNRYYYAQTGKQAMVIDERVNGGGLFANWIVEQMNRPLINFWEIRDSETLVTPAGQVFGPKVMIINEFAGSGGDWLPWYFRRTGGGKLVGKRTWGGLVGIYGFPGLIDGGMVTAPILAFWTPEGEWLVENVGVAPDVEVELDPKAWREGRDPQLEAAVALVLEELEKNPLPTHERPAFPDYYKDHPQP
jgi:tricorn protease